MTWPPRSEDEILAALATADVAESNRLDMKLMIGDKDSARRETAKDLASFAVDGGALLIGIREDKEARSFHPAPIDLRAAVERVEQIAANRVDPPLVVRPREIVSNQVGLGYLWVEIPASPDAPHMVDGRYYGRGERTNRILSDADVLRLHEQRRGDSDRAVTALNRLQDADPFPRARKTAPTTEPPKPRFGHLYLSATPRRASPGLAEGLVWDRHEELLTFATQIENSGPSLFRSWGPHFMGGIYFATRSDHASVSTISGDAAALEREEQYGVDVRIHTDGAAGMIVTGASHPLDGDAVVNDGMIVANAWRVILWAKCIAEETGYTGTWDLGLRATNLAGRSARSRMSRSHFDRDDVPAFDQDEYQRTTSITRSEFSNPGQAVRALTEPVLRGLGSWSTWVNELPELAPGESH